MGAIILKIGYNKFKNYRGIEKNPLNSPFQI
jgi:hypothetical protein